MEKFVPEVEENYSLGMNSLDNPKYLLQNMYQSLINAYPGISLKPINGVKDIRASLAPIGNNNDDGGLVHTIFRPETMFIQAGGKNFVFAWSWNYAGNKGYTLEVWNVTDGTRTALLYDTFSTDSDIRFSMTKLYDAVYIVVNKEMTGYANSNMKRNKIIEWNSTTSAWVIREMGIYEPGSAYSASVESVQVPPWSSRVFHKMVEFDGRLWIIGGTESGSGDIHQGLFYSYDGITWVPSWISSTYFKNISAMAVCVFNGYLWVIGGRSAYASCRKTIYYTADGETWNSEPSPAFEARYGFGLVVYNSKMWIIGGGYFDTGSIKAYSDVWSSSNGITWTRATAAAAFGNKYEHKCLVYDDKMWIIGGVVGVGGSGTAYDSVYYSTDGITWTLATDAAAYGHKQLFCAAVLNGMMWVFGGYLSPTYYNDSYYSLDGITWTQLTASAGYIAAWGMALCVFKSKFYICGGTLAGGVYAAAKLYYSGTGQAFTLAQEGLTTGKYYDYAFTYVRRTDADSKLAAMADFNYKTWRPRNGLTYCGVDERQISGTVILAASNSADNLTGGTAFLTELAVGNYVRIDGQYKMYAVTNVKNNTTATLTNADLDTYNLKRCSVLPAIGDSITTDIYNPGVLEGVEEIDNRKTVYVGTPENGIVYIDTPSTISVGIAQGATHLRVYRTLGNASETVAKGLGHRFVVDIAINKLYGSSYPAKTFLDVQNDTFLSYITDTLDITGYDVPPFGRYSIFAGDIFWIFGIEGDEDKAYFSVRRGTTGVNYDTRFPQKYASMFDLDEDYVKCIDRDGQKATGIAYLMGDLYLFYERKIYIIYNSDPENEPFCIAPTIGCAFPNTICNAYITRLGGEIIYFNSESGPAYISSGGKVNLFNEFKIAQLWPGKTALWPTEYGIIEGATARTSWYTRNKVHARFWNNCIWIFYGDSQDTESNTLLTNRIFGYRFSNDGVACGPFQRYVEKYSDTLITTPVSIYEPQMLIPVDNVTGYTLSHVPFFTLYFGTATTRFDMMDMGANVWRYTWDGTGTAPQFVNKGLRAGDTIIINSPNFNAGNNGYFVVTTVAATYFECTNATGVAETDKVLGSATGMKVESKKVYRLTKLCDETIFVDRLYHPGAL